MHLGIARFKLVSKVDSSQFKELNRLGIYYSFQNKGTDCRDPMLPIHNVCRMSTRSSFYIFCSTLCCKTLITAKNLNLLRSQTEEYQTPLVYLANRNSIPIWYQKHFLRPILIKFKSKKWMESINKPILWEGCLCQYYVLVIGYMS